MTVETLSLGTSNMLSKFERSCFQNVAGCEHCERSVASE